LVKLLALPLLVYQFQRSENGTKVFIAFYISCIVVLSLSWLNWLDQRTIMFSTTVVGVPVKNWITQGVEFILCIFGSVPLAVIMWHRRRFYASLAFSLAGAAFLSNLIFVQSSRTSLVSLPVLLPILTYRYIGGRRSVILYTLVAIIGGATWFASPKLRERIDSIQEQLVWYEKGTVEASVGLRLGYWSKSLKFISEAPFMGHGTGSIRGLFEREASGKSVTEAEIVANPHNQTLYFAIEWGVIGVILLYAMWVSHFRLFTQLRWMSWIGMLVVSQNIFDSLFNSHLSDYVEGWIYVIGVGIAAGAISRRSVHSAEPDRLQDHTSSRDPWPTISGNQEAAH
jgi:O-antigen ligase